MPLIIKVLIFLLVSHIKHNVGDTIYAKVLLEELKKSVDK